jgi:hypothetical protein
MHQRQNGVANLFENLHGDYAMHFAFARRAPSQQPSATQRLLTQMLLPTSTGFYPKTAKHLAKVMTCWVKFVMQSF